MKYARHGLLFLLSLALAIATGQVLTLAQDRQEKKSDTSATQDAKADKDKQDKDKEKDKDENPPAVISDKDPSSDVSAPTPIKLGEIVTGRLGNSGETGKYHFWLVNLPAGKYKVILDVKRADDSGGNIGGSLQWFSPDGEKMDGLGGMNEINYRHRSIHRFGIKKPIKLILRYSNAFTISDYWLGLFQQDDKVRSPFFVKCPKVGALTLGMTVSAVLDGAEPLARDAFYNIELRPGDYKVTAEYVREDGKGGNVGGNVTAFGPEGDQGSGMLGANDIDFSSKKVGKFSLADKQKIIFRLRAAFTKEIIKFTISKWQES